MWIDLVCNGVVGIMILATAFIIWRIEMIRRVSQLSTSTAKNIALMGGIFWLLLYFIFNAGWTTGKFFNRMGLFTALLLVIPYVAYLRLALCLRLEKIGNTISPAITDLERVVNDEGLDTWYVKYEYLGEYHGKRKVQPTMQILAAQYTHASHSADEREGAIAAALPNAAVRYLSNHPNIHRFEYDEPDIKIERKKMLQAQKTGFKMDWEALGMALVFAFLLVVIIVGIQTWMHRDDLVVDANIFWMATSLELEPGQCVRLIPSGRVSISQTAGYDGEISPSGWEALCTPDESGKCAMNDAPYGALVTRIAGNEPFVLDKSMKVSDVDGGYLWLSVNDNKGRFTDNSGEYRVRYKILNRPCD